MNASSTGLGVVRDTYDGYVKTKSTTIYAGNVDENIALGYHSMGACATGYPFGPYVGASNLRNVAIGCMALENIRSSQYNVAMGYQAGSTLSLNYDP
tara:strand:+ start:143 stop:433 length:291 start_codon:yes stop_codon:yes gene_type:complete